MEETVDQKAVKKMHNQSALSYQDGWKAREQGVPYDKSYGPAWCAGWIDCDCEQF